MLSANRPAFACIGQGMNIFSSVTAAALAAAGLVLSAGALAPTQAAEPPAAERAAKAYVVNATISSNSVIRGSRVVIKGSVKQGKRGDLVRVHVKYPDGPWKATKLTDRLDGAGRFQSAHKITSSRSRAYRVVKPAGNGFQAGRSKVMRVTVYSWRNLTSLAPVSAQDTRETSQVKMDAVAYPSSLVGTKSVAAGRISYNLERKCLRLQTRAGVADVTEETATGTASLKMDGVEKFARSFTLTQSAAVDLDIKEVFRFSFDWTSANTAGPPESQHGAAVALGTPQILCRD